MSEFERDKQSTEDGEMNNRKVMVSEYVKQPQHKWGLEEKGEAVFHQFGCNYEEFESGPGNFSTAIIEWPDGSVDNVPVSHIRFLDKE